MSSIVPKSFKSAFDGKRRKLRRRLKVKEGLLELMEDSKLITTKQIKSIKAENATDERQASKLMDELLRCDDSKVDVFLKCLVENSQRHVVSIILGQRIVEWERQSTQVGVEQETSREMIPATSNRNSDPKTVAIDEERKLFVWLSKQDWVEEYYTDDTGVKIGVTGISAKEAEKRLRDHAAHLVRKLNISISEAPPDVEFKYTAGPSDPLEPCSVVKSVNASRIALYSGSVKSRFMKEVGLTVGHLVDGPGDTIVNGFDCTINDVIVRVDEILNDPDYDKITADLCIFTFPSVDLKSNNVVPSDQTAGLPLRLWKHPQCRGVDAFIINQHGARINGIIIVDDFHNKSMRVNKYNVLMFLPDTGAIAVVQGDSGAPVMHADPGGNGHVYVLGITIGTLPHNAQVATIAIRLFDVLRAFGRSPLFNGQLFNEAVAAESEAEPPEAAMAASVAEPNYDVMEDVDFPRLSHSAS